MQTTFGITGEGIELEMGLSLDELVGNAQPATQSVTPAMSRDLVMLNFILISSLAQHF